MRDFSRQSFLGVDSEDKLRAAKIGLVGYGGGGSHYGQQFGHIGIGNFVVVDDDLIEESNRHRFVGSKASDVILALAKVDIAEREILRGNPDANVITHQCRWQNATSELIDCDIIFGAVDSFAQRDELERFCRRNLIPYIDIGMTVTKLGDGHHVISGQVIQSLPGSHCLRCCNVVTDDRITQEADQYGEAGPQPQVIWPNGVLASTAVGFSVALLTPWYKATKNFRWLSYDGNKGTLVEPAIFSKFLMHTECTHHPLSEVGDPFSDIRLWSPLPLLGASPQKRIMVIRRLWNWLTSWLA